MAFHLVLERADSSGREGVPGDEKAVGENVFLSELPSGYPCYVFYYPGERPDRELERGLRRLGDEAGENLFVNIGRLNDPQFGRLAKLFEIRSYPVLVLTAIAPLAAHDGAGVSAFVRLDSPRLLASTERTLECVRQVFTLFLSGDVARAIAVGRWRERAELLRVAGEFFSGALGALWEFVAERDLSVSFFEGRLELKRSGD